MRARDLVLHHPVLRSDDDALDAARVLAEQRLPGVLVLDSRGQPSAVLLASRLIQLLVPGYVLEDPTLAAVVDEPHADRLSRALAGLTVGDCLPKAPMTPSVADPNDTALEIAALMVREHTSMVAVVERRSEEKEPAVLGVITASHLLQRLLDVRA
ncbi:CBS domain-containing protein [Microlunatus panaciterrae]|uniref:CBS domain-containing protein n=1 Tax=Microlunatus panaciterrae TaxID=400768 RepID=A0ABS2RJN0_9ACTN|nr:CBS domain-containing protein [Microlunatus panaciterrae]MBM7799210.1 hypothetical protein [Microlunatus panaciterrae]